MSNTDITLLKFEYKAVDVIRYYVQVNQTPAQEVTHDIFSRYLKAAASYTTQSHDKGDSIMVMHELSFADNEQQA